MQSPLQLRAVGPLRRLGSGPEVARPPWQLPSARPDRTARAAATLMLLVGLLNLVSALMPAQRARIDAVDSFIPGLVSSGATALTAAAGLGLILLAGGLRRHRRSAYLATVALLLGGAVLHVIKGLDIVEAL